MTNLTIKARQIPAVQVGTEHRLVGTDGKTYPVVAIYGNGTYVRIWYNVGGTVRGASFEKKTPIWVEA